MGIDPMTHRPRTDFFAALPQLIALVNLRQFVEQQPWDHTARLQTEAVQAVNLQYMHSLLHSAAPIAASSATNSSLNILTTDLDQISFPSPQQMLSPSVLEGICGMDLARQVLQNQMPSITFDHTVGNTDPNLINNVESNEQHSSEGENNSKKRLSLSENSLPPLTDMAVSNMCNSICTSNYHSVSSPLPNWPELLLDEELLKDFS
jgi:myb proto-oncogene protein